MKILTLQFVLALVVLFFPRNALRAGVNLVRRKRRRSSGSERILEPWKDREPGDPRITPAVEFLKPRNYLDLVRAAAGGVAIWGGFYVPPALAADPAAGGHTRAALQQAALFEQRYGQMISALPPLLQLRRRQRCWALLQLPAAQRPSKHGPLRTLGLYGLLAWLPR